MHLDSRRCAGRPGVFAHEPQCRAGAERSPTREQIESTDCVVGMPSTPATIATTRMERFAEILQEHDIAATLRLSKDRTSPRAAVS